MDSILLNIRLREVSDCDSGVECHAASWSLWSRGDGIDVGVAIFRLVVVLVGMVIGGYIVVVDGDPDPRSEDAI